MDLIAVLCITTQGRFPQKSHSYFVMKRMPGYEPYTHRGILADWHGSSTEPVGGLNPSGLAKQQRVPKRGRHI